MEQFPCNELTMRSAITELQNLDVSSLLVPSTEQQAPTSLSMDPGYSINFSNPDVPIASGMDGYNLFEPNGEIPYISRSTYSLAGQNHCPNTHFSYGYNTHSSMDLQEPDWSQFTSSFTSFQPETPDFLPIQHPIEPPLNLNVKVAPKIPKKQSKELVGMGLYDHPDRDSPSSLDYSASSGYFVNTHRESVGKGLKLEETWQPPKNPEGEEEEADDDAEEEEEEAYSSDEADEDLPPIVSPTSVAETQKSLYPTYSDLSNQTFFLDDDSYASCLAFDQQAIQVCQKPSVSDAACGGNDNYNFVWI